MSSATQAGSEVVSAEIASLFADVFEVSTVGTDEDFFRLGGDSLLAESLVLSIERKFGTTLSVSTLLEAPTPRALSTFVLRDIRPAAERSLIAIRPEGRGPPIICIHGMNGNITYGRSLATVFGNERPIYAIRARGLLPRETPATSVEGCAADYIRLIRKVRPSGPYLLLAPCGPSIIAYEMAQQLTRDGHTVSGLVMADPAVSGHDVWLQHGGLAKALVQARSAPRASRSSAAKAAARAASPAERTKMVEKTLAAAIRAYSPSPFPGKVLLLYSTEWSMKLMDPQRGFPALVKHLQAVEVSETHLTLQNDFRGKPAAVIRAFLEEVAPL